MILEDGLASNGPHIKLLQQLNMRYILGAKPGNLKFLFYWVASSPETRTLGTVDIDRKKYPFRYHNQVPLHDAN